MRRNEERDFRETESLLENKMTHSGTIKLIWKGEINNQAKYGCLPDRNKIINMWRELYGMEFGKCEIQISPEIIEKKPQSK